MCAAPVHVFISYRREDTSGIAGRLYDRLAARFGGDRVFMDVDSISPGFDFGKVVEDAVESCDVLLVLIGRDWLQVTNSSGRRRLDDPGDYVAAEIRAGLDRNIPVIPVLVDGARPPHDDDLPRPLAALARRQSARVDHESFTADVVRLMDRLENVAVASASQREPSPRSASDAVVHASDSSGSTWRVFGIVVGVTLVAALVISVIIIAANGRRSSSAEAKGPSTSVPATDGSTTRVFDEAALEFGVAQILRDSYGIAATNVTCPSQVVVLAGVRFVCTAVVAGNVESVAIRVTTGAGDYEVGRPGP